MNWTKYFVILVLLIVSILFSFNNNYLNITNLTTLLPYIDKGDVSLIAFFYLGEESLGAITEQNIELFFMKIPLLIAPFDPSKLDTLLTLNYKIYYSAKLVALNNQIFHKAANVILTPFDPNNIENEGFYINLRTFIKFYLKNQMVLRVGIDVKRSIFINDIHYNKNEQFKSLLDILYKQYQK